MKIRLLLVLGLLMFCAGIGYGQHRQCDVWNNTCTFQIINCQIVGGRCPTGTCGNPDEAGCCIYENGYCANNIFDFTTICGNSCNP